MTAHDPLVEVFPCEQHEGILRPSLEWHRALQIADDCPECEVRTS